MKICARVDAELRQLEKLQSAYGDHLGAEGRRRLGWLERAIDAQQKTVRVFAGELRREVPAGCRNCDARGNCPYRESVEHCGV